MEKDEEESRRSFSAAVIEFRRIDRLLSNLRHNARAQSASVTRNKQGCARSLHRDTEHRGFGATCYQARNPLSCGRPRSTELRFNENRHRDRVLRLFDRFPLLL